MMKDILGRILAGHFFHNPVFVVGASRSGTSVLLQALGKHPLILSMDGEAPFITSMGGASYLFESAVNREYYINSIKVTQDYLYSSLRRIAFEATFGRHYGLKTTAKAVLRDRGSFLAVRYWCAKTFPDDVVYKGLIGLYRNAKFIYIVRNGCDAVQSMTKYSGFRHQDFEKNCRAWARSAQNFDYLRNCGAAVMVRHEHLVENPETVFRSIFSFLGIDYHGNSTNYIRNTLVHPLDKPTQAKVNVKDALQNRKPSYKEWTGEQRELFKDICGETMQRLEYEIPF